MVFAYLATPIPVIPESRASGLSGTHERQIEPAALGGATPNSALSTLGVPVFACGETGMTREGSAAMRDP
jgi:hypothetical protein